MSVSQASGTGLLDLRRLDLGRGGAARSPAPARASCRRSRRPAGGGGCGRSTRAAGRRSPRRAWTPPIGDGAASNIGLGLRRPEPRRGHGRHLGRRTAGAGRAGRRGAAGRCRTGCGATGSTSDRDRHRRRVLRRRQPVRLGAATCCELPEGDALEEALKAGGARRRASRPTRGSAATGRPAWRPPAPGRWPAWASAPRPWRSSPGLMDGVCLLVRPDLEAHRVHRGPYGRGGARRRRGGRVRRGGGARSRPTLAPRDGDLTSRTPRWAAPGRRSSRCEASRRPLHVSYLTGRRAATVGFPPPGWMDPLLGVAGIGET